MISDEARLVKRRNNNYILRSLKSDEAFPLKGEMLVGRETGCAIALLSGQVSGYHAKINVMRSGVYIEDLQSESGTFVNGKRIKGRVLLSVGDKVRFDEVAFRLDASEDTVRASTEQADQSPPPASDSAAGSAPGPVNGRSGSSNVQPFPSRPRARPAPRPEPAPHENLSKDADEANADALDNSTDESTPQIESTESVESGELQDSTDGTANHAPENHSAETRKLLRSESQQQEELDLNGNSETTAAGANSDDSPVGETQTADEISETTIEQDAVSSSGSADPLPGTGAATAEPVDHLPREANSTGHSDTDRSFEQPESEPAATESTATEPADYQAGENAALTEGADQGDAEHAAFDASATAGDAPPPDADESRPEETAAAGSDSTQRSKSKFAGQDFTTQGRDPAESLQIEEFGELPPDAPRESTQKPPPSEVIELDRNDYSSILGEAEEDPQWVERSRYRDRNRIPEKDFDAGTGPRLIITSAPLRGKFFELADNDTGVWKIGQAEDAFIQLTDMSVAADHAHLTRMDDGYQLAATHPKNFLVVNGTSTNCTMLAGNDRIQIGSTDMVFKLDEIDDPSSKDALIDRNVSLRHSLIGALVILTVVIAVIVASGM